MKCIVWAILLVCYWNVIVGETTSSAFNGLDNFGPVDNPVSLFEVQGAREVYKFTSGGLYRATISETAGIGSLVTSPVKMGLYIQDNDPMIEYMMSGISQYSPQISSNCSGATTFSIKGERIENFNFLRITTRRMLSEESCKSYLLTIKARNRDSKKTVDTTKVLIKVHVASNDKVHPRFNQTNVSKTIPSNYPLFQPIVHLTIARQSKHHIGKIYFMLDQQSKYFALNPVNGVLFLRRSLPVTINRHDLIASVQKWNLELNRKTMKRNSNVCKITIGVSAVNQYAPSISVDENTDKVEVLKNGTVIATITVSDRDKGKNGMIDSFVISSGNENGQFDFEKVGIDNTVYLLRFTGQLFGSKLSRQGQLTFIATDKGDPPKSSTQFYSFNLMDFILVKPYFSNRSYFANVSEMAPANYTVIQIKTLNLKPNAIFSYALALADQNNNFRIKSDTGEIQVAQTLDADTTSEYTLKVVLNIVSDDTITISTDVHIQVEDFNDHVPVFVSNIHYVEIDEDIPLNTSIYTVKATDKDKGDNGLLSYWLPYPGRFSVNSNTGVISVKEFLDRDSGIPEFAHLVVRVRDDGFPVCREAETMVNIKIKTKNDNPPVIKQANCQITLSRSAVVGTTLVKVQAIDIDKDQVTQTSFLMSSGNAGHYFAVDKSSGDVMVAKPLGSAHHLYNLRVSASDGTHRSANVVILRINIDDKKASGKHVLCTDSIAYKRALKVATKHQSTTSVRRIIYNKPPQNIHAPKFNRKQIIITVEEDIAVGSELMTLKASDKDEGYEGLLTYFIVGGNYNQCFGLNMITGKLKTLTELDREQVSKYELSISAWDSGVTRKADLVKVIVIVEDVNDNPPVFDKKIYNISVPENSAAGQTVLKLVANDDDTGINQRVTYLLVNDHGKLFFIDYNSGELIINKPLDFEQEQLYLLKVLAFDGSSSTQHVSQAKIVINVLDKNDYTPVISPEIQNLFVMKDLPEQSPITQVTADDPDSGLGGILSFSLVKSKGSELFSIDSTTGLMSLKQNLTSSHDSVYNLVVTVHDQGYPSLASTAHINVNIIERISKEVVGIVSNRNGFIEYSVPENAVPVYKVVELVKVVSHLGKKDSFLFSIIDGTDVTMFNVTDTTGLLSTTASLDHEILPSYWLTVQVIARQSGQFHSNMQLLIKVEDVNDNFPIFNPPVYESKIPENSKPDKMVVKVSAYDLDSGKNGQLTYSIVDGNDEGHFKIDGSTGVVTTTNMPLDYERKNMYRLVVCVKDGGSTPRESQASLTIFIQDENDNKPKFKENLIIDLLVPMGSTISKGTLLGQVIATDNDSGDNGDLTFKILGGNEDRKLKLDPKSGQLFNTAILDSFDAFNLEIEAADNGYHAMSSKTIIEIVAKDSPVLSRTAVPTFKQKQVNMSLAEDTPIGYKIKILLATYKFSNLLQYSLKSGNEDQTFQINSFGRKSNLELIKKLDSAVVYHIVISATDGYSSCNYTLNIEVKDVNDHYPVPEMIERIVSVSENVAPGTKLLTVTASDLDYGMNGQIGYSLKSAAVKKSLELFDIGRTTGDITVKGQLDYEDIRSHVLIVAMTDSGKNPKESTMYVIVNVNDVNEWVPQFVKPAYHVTVQESLPRGSDVIKVVAKDKDQGLDATLKYSITAGNYGYAFSIKPRSGVIQTNRVLKALTISEYVLTVEARDDGAHGLSATTNVTVKLLKRGHRPGFSKNLFAASVYENQPINTLVESVYFNGLMTFYAIIKDVNCANGFQISPFTGIITTKKEFDAEKISSCLFRVQSLDGDGYSQEATLQVKINDLNDNPPVFGKEVYSGYIMENAKENSKILDEEGNPLVITVRDVDIEPQNRELTYEMVSPGMDSYFKIDEITGALMTAKLSLDYEKEQKYDLVVKVSDRGTPSLSAIASVVVHVRNLNDVAPKFSESYYDVVMYLSAYKNLYVTSLKASDQDNLGNLTYSIVQQDTPSLLTIDPSNGAVVISDSSQATRGWYNADVQVSDGERTGKAKLRVVFKPFPPSSLQFSSFSFEAHIRENTSSVQTIFNPRVFGYKIGQKLRFSLGKLQDTFTIKEDTGVIKTKPGLIFDREKISSYHLVVMVQDDNSPPRMARCQVLVIVDDVNDCQPTFPSPPIFFIVPKNSKTGSVVATVQASDCDSGKNGQVSYSIKSDRSGIFGIDSTSGALRIVSQLTGLSTPSQFTLIIEARDNGQSPFKSEADVSVRIESGDVCIFEKPSYTVELQEDAVVGKVFRQLHARCPKGRPVFNIISGNKFDQFYCDLNTGELSLSYALDFEKEKSYSLIVRAKDSNTGASSQATLNILVKDINDNPPTFKDSPYYARIKEDSVEGTKLVRVFTTDLDSGENKRRSYEIVRENTLFPGTVSINADTGVLQTQKKLDYETEKRFDVTVRVFDHGTPSLSSETVIKVFVMDVNDNAPVFQKPHYSATVLENAGLTHFVTQVVATDADETDLSKLRYKIISGAGKKFFRVDETSGEVLLSKVHRLVLGKVYKLKLSVDDGKFTTYTTLDVVVGQKNNHSPEFQKDMYYAHVTENYPADSYVAMVTATDQDSGTFGEIVYGIDSHQTAKYFKIDRTSGIITTRRPLDREMMNSVTIPIRAKDKGGKSAFCDVQVSILDENDHKPEFLMPSYTAVVPVTRATVGESVIRVTAVDKDEGENSALTYSLVGQTSPFVFGINGSSGLITFLLQPRESIYNFYVRVNDNGYLKLKSYTQVRVSIQTLLFQFKHKEYFFSFSEAIQGSVPQKFELIDNNGTLVTSNISYSILRGTSASTNKLGTFSITPQGGLQISKKLDYEQVPSYELTVGASRSSFSVYAIVRVAVLDENDNKPEFESKRYVVIIPEDSPKGTKIIQVRAHDKDKKENGKVSYEIAAESKIFSNVFSIDKNSGWITSESDLDRESVPSYVLTIRALDHGRDKTLVGTSSVIINLDDVNDSPPVFSKRVYSKSIREDSPVGSEVVVLNTTDKDAKFSVIYYIVGGDLRNRFGIEQLSGRIFVNGKLDREIFPRYQLNITAYDGVFTDSALVEIEVMDVNDNAPVCHQPHLRVPVLENITIGTFIATINATDRDEDDHNKITFAIFSHQDKFSIDNRTGVIQLDHNLDREKKSSYNFIVSASDGNDVCYSNVTVDIVDVNDSPPLFTEARYIKLVAMDSEKNAVLLRVEASDQDVGINRKVTYAFANASTSLVFSIERETGVISLHSRLLWRDEEKFVFGVVATDGGVPPLSSEVTVEITVSTIMNCPFTKNEYKKEIREDTKPTYEIETVSVTCTGKKFVVIYSIAGDDYEIDRLFDINEKTGKLSLKAALDYEVSHIHTFTVEALMVKPSGKTILISSASIKIKVKDCNDNKPVFSRASYEAAVNEGSRDRVLVTELFAQDNDTSNKVRYSIIKSSPDTKKFAIDPLNGRVTVQGNLDREETDKYKLMVRAQDNGNPPLFSDVPLVIKIKDLNDNPPVVEKQIKTLIRADNPVGKVVLQLNPTDADGPSNSKPFTFSILSGENEMFKLNSTSGELTVARHLSTHNTTYTMILRTTDNGSPAQFADTTVLLTVVKNSLNPPTVQPVTVYVNMYARKFNGGTIGKIIADDPDKGDILRYSLMKTDGNFSVGFKDGSIKMSSKLSPGLYSLSVKVTDGTNMVITRVSVRVSAITPDVVKNSVTIRITGKTLSSFVSSSLSPMISTLARYKSCSVEHVYLWSIQTAPGNKLDVVFAIKKPGRKEFFDPINLRETLEDQFRDFEKSCNVVVFSVGIFPCDKHRCSKGMECRNKISMLNQWSILTSAATTFLSYKNVQGSECVCPEGTDCLPASDSECVKNPCKSGLKCMDRPIGYECVCPPGKHCQNDCRGDRCHTGAVTFNGNSYIRYSMTNDKTKMSSFSVSVRTTELSGTIFSAKGDYDNYDYFILEIVEGKVRVRFNYGSGEGLGRIDQMKINDGKWHDVKVTRKERNVRLTLNGGKYMTEAVALGSMRFLNVDMNNIIVGGELPRRSIRSTAGTVSNGFFGCMESPRLNDNDLPLSGNNALAKAVPSGVSENCSIHVCPPSFCHNDGQCKIIEQNGYKMPSCLCTPGYTGYDCSKDVNECDAVPCQNSGVCVNTNGSFICNCVDKNFEGKVCEARVLAYSQTEPLGTLEFIYIGATVFCLIIISIVIICVCRCYHKRKRKAKARRYSHDRQIELKIKETENELSPQPPPPPPRRGDVEEPSTRLGSRAPSWDYADLPAEMVLNRRKLSASESFLNLPMKNCNDMGEYSIANGVPRVPKRPRHISETQSIPDVPEKPTQYRSSRASSQCSVRSQSYPDVSEIGEEGLEIIRRGTKDIEKFITKAADVVDELLGTRCASPPSEGDTQSECSQVDEHERFSTGHLETYDDNEVEYFIPGNDQETRSANDSEDETSKMLESIPDVRDSHGKVLHQESQL